MIDTDNLIENGASLPADAVAALAIFEAATSTRDHNTTETLLDDVRTGKIKAEQVNKKIESTALARVAAREAADVAAQVGDAAARQHDAALRAHADQLIEQMRPAFDEAADTFRRAADLRLDQYTDADTATRHGGPAAAAYAELADAARALDTIRSAVYDVAGMPGPDVPRVARFISPDSIRSARMKPGDFGRGSYPWTDLDDAESIYDRPAGPGLHTRPTPAPGAHWLALITAGHTLRLNSTTETAALIAKAEALEADAESAGRRPRVSASTAAALQRQADRHIAEIERAAAK